MNKDGLVVHNRFLYLFCFEILLFSGCTPISNKGMIMLFVWLFTCSILYIKRHNHINNKKDLAIAIIIGVWVFFTSVVLSSPIDNYWVTYVIFPLGAALAIQCIDLKDFKLHYLCCLKILLTISIIIHFLYNFGLINAVQEDGGAHWAFHFFNVQWGWYYVGDFRINRFSSVYWEPGQFQIVAIYSLMLFFDEISNNLTNFKYLLKNFGIIIFAIIISYSTTGYLSLAFFFAIAFLFQNKHRSFLRKIILGGLITGVTVLLLNSPAVQNKLAEKDDISESTSYSIRQLDTAYSLYLTFEKPLFGWGINSKDLYSAFSKIDRTASSNGWLYSSSSLGLPYVIFVLLLMWRGVTRMYGNRFRAFFLLLVLIISQANEAVTVFPYVWLYVFRFKSYSENTYIES